MTRADNQKARRGGLSWPVAWSIAAVLGVAAASLAAWLVYGPANDSASAADVEPGDRLSAAIDGLEQNSFYVAPELRDRLSARQVRTIREAAESSDQPLYLAYMTNATDAGYYQNYNAVDIIADHIGEDALYAIVDERLSTSETSRGVGFPYVDPDALLGRDHVALEEYAKAIGKAPDEDLAEDSDYWGGPGGGSAAGAMFAVGGYLVLLLIIWITSLFRRPA